PQVSPVAPQIATPRPAAPPVTTLASPQPASPRAAVVPQVITAQPTAVVRPSVTTLPSQRPRFVVGPVRVNPELPGRSVDRPIQVVTPNPFRPPLAGGPARLPNVTTLPIREIGAAPRVATSPSATTLPNRSRTTSTTSPMVSVATSSAPILPN